MNFDLIKKIPVLAKETKDKFSKALTTFQTDESSYFFNESLNKEQIFEFLNSKYNQEISSALKKIIAVTLSLSFMLFIIVMLKALPPRKGCLDLCPKDNPKASN